MDPSLPVDRGSGFEAQPLVGTFRQAAGIWLMVKMLRPSMSSSSTIRTVVDSGCGRATTRTAGRAGLSGGRFAAVSVHRLHQGRSGPGAGLFAEAMTAVAGCARLYRTNGSAPV